MRPVISRHSKFWPALAIAALSLVAYLNSLYNSFHFDDFHGIVHNPTIRDLTNIPTYFVDTSMWSLGHRRDWRPVLQITYALNYYIGGLDPALFRVFNFLFHVGASVLVFFIIVEVTDRRRPQISSSASKDGIYFAFFPAALFAIHTANSASVNYIWSRSSVLAALFCLLAFYCFLRGPLTEGKNRGMYHLAGLLSFFLGVATKATAAILPPLLILYELLLLNPGNKNPIHLFREEPWRIRKYIPVTAIFLGYVILRAILILYPFATTQAPGNVGPLAYCVTQFRAWLYYLQLFIWPDPLLVDFHGFGWSQSLGDYQVILSLGAIALILGSAWFVRKSEPVISFFTFWYFLALLPESSVIPLSDAVNSYRPYLAYVGPTTVLPLIPLRAASWLWADAKNDSANSSKFRLYYMVTLCVVLILLGTVTVKRNLDWRDERTLWSDVLRKDPSNPRAHMNLGMIALGDENYRAAEQFFTRAIQLDQKIFYGFMFRGYFNGLLGRNDLALSDLSKAIELDTNSPYSRFLRAELYRKLDEYDKALMDYEAAIRSNRYYLEAYVGLASLYRKKGDGEAAAKVCGNLLEIDSTDPRSYTCLGEIFLEQDRAGDAVKIYHRGVARIPEDNELWYGLGTAYERNEMFKDAASAYEKAGRLRR